MRLLGSQALKKIRLFVINNFLGSFVRISEFCQVPSTAKERRAERPVLQRLMTWRTGLAAEQTSVLVWITCVFNNIVA